MPRPVNFALLDLFDYSELNKLKCNYGKCEARLLHKHGGNLKRHLKSLHPQVYLSYLENKTFLQDQAGFYMQKRLIDLVREKPILWDRSRSSASNCNSNSYVESWEEIGQELNLNVEICKQKWKNLEIFFRKETINKDKTDPESDQSLTSNWKLFSTLLFLRDDLSTGENPGNSKQEEEIDSCFIKEETFGSETEEEKMLDSILNDIYKNEQSRKRLANNDNDSFDGKAEAKIIKTENENDEEKLFLLSLLPYLKTVPENRRLLERHRIQGVLLEDKVHSNL